MISAVNHLQLEFKRSVDLTPFRVKEAKAWLFLD